MQQAKYKYLVFSIMVILFSLPSYAQDSYVVNVQSLNVRETPSAKSTLLYRLVKGEVVAVINQESNEWWQISYEGQEGFVSAKYLISLDEAEQYKDWVKEHLNTGDQPDCENYTPMYDYDIDNSLDISVGNNTDAVVKLMTYNNVCIRMAYVKSGERFSMKNIPENIYYTKIAYGKEIRKLKKDGNCIVKFLRDPIYKKDLDEYDFYKVKKPDTYENGSVVHHWGIPYFELSLNIVYSNSNSNKGRDIRSNKITEEEFNR